VGSRDNGSEYAMTGRERMRAGQTINFMVQHLGSPERALLSFYDAPDLALALIDKAVAITIEKGQAFAACGIDCIYIGDSYASASVISPEVYQRFCVPAYRAAATSSAAPAPSPAPPRQRTSTPHDRPWTCTGGTLPGSQMVSKAGRRM